MNNDISNITKLNFTSTPQIDSRTAKLQDVKNKGSDHVKNSENIPQAKESVVPDEESKTDGKRTQNLASLEDIRKLAEQGNKALDEAQRNLQFKVDDTTHQVVVSVVDRKSGEVLRQIPSEEVLALAKRLKELDGEQGQGVFLKERA